MLVAGSGDERSRSRAFTRFALAAAILVASFAAAFSFVAAGAAPLFAPPEPRIAAAREATVDRTGERLSRNAERMADELFGRAALPFEIASLVLIVAVGGAVHLARERSEERISD
jgi:NADH:ubiquinone oxidoreductase subunit 6 (subunit J)